jgi:hypothetical protein
MTLLILISQVGCDYPGSGAPVHPPSPDALIGKSQEEVVGILGNPIFDKQRNPLRRESHFMFRNHSSRKDGIAGFQIFFEKGKVVEVRKILNSM